MSRPSTQYAWNRTATQRPTGVVGSGERADGQLAAGTYGGDLHREALPLLQHGAQLGEFGVDLQREVGVDRLAVRGQVGKVLHRAPLDRGGAGGLKSRGALAGQRTERTGEVP